MNKKTSVDIVNHFWREVWQSRNPDAVDDLVAEDFGWRGHSFSYGIQAMGQSLSLEDQRL